MQHDVETVTEAAATDAPVVQGMPQLDFSSYPNQIFWLLVALVAIYLILTRVGLPRVASVLSERRGAITNDLLAAEELKQKAKDAEAAYNAALAKARADAADIAAETKASIDAQLQQAIAQADAEIATRAAESEVRISEIRAGMRQSVSEVATDTAQALVAALGGKADASVDAAVAARVKG
ncbi:F0F1 ATP synthase subunit B' [Falsirhodobacter halotolerans]|uniref:F0F1 ATP synthase subunit B' n=1 Tax=Falsirhodobacter halotolerans TaxID=1146892 RepID=UPI001FD57B31|nr:F0F1 ATP synthase subunit B' [Falsirhodobacter halotolerans]MCJ8138786.1 F0F1 ATP synthase subunit B' [Falsirhodobacter halotolerans]